MANWGFCAALTWAAILASPVGAEDYRPAFDPSKLKGAQPSPVLVLGTPHLSGWPDSVSQSLLDPLINRLADWRPDAIAIEALSGAQCDHLRRFPARYADTVKSYCWDPAPARAATGLDVPEATAEAARMLAAWPASPTPVERRRLAALFLAGGERASALVQWLHLPKAERRAGDGLDAALVAILEGLETRRNEDYWIAVPLAVKLGHQRVFAVDDHTSDAPVADEAGFEAAISKAWDNPAAHQRRASDETLMRGLTDSDGILTFYRTYNAPETAELAFRSDFGAALAEPSSQRFGRSYAGYWETRNLRMVANIREVAAAKPGQRVLAIVGASHKGYYEAYLAQMHDMAPVDAVAVLR